MGTAASGTVVGERSPASLGASCGLADTAAGGPQTASGTARPPPRRWKRAAARPRDPRSAVAQGIDVPEPPRGLMSALFGYNLHSAVIRHATCGQLRDDARRRRAPSIGAPPCQPPERDAPNFTGCSCQTVEDGEHPNAPSILSGCRRKNFEEVLVPMVQKVHVHMHAVPGQSRPEVPDPAAA